MTRILLLAGLAAVIASSSSSSSSCLVAAEPAPVGDASGKEIDAARRLQSDADRIGEELTVKMLSLEVEYHKKKEPVLKERNALLKSIPNFWSTIISRHPNHHSWMRGDDEEILKYLIDVEISDLEREEGNYYPLHTFKLAMRFKPNEYFTDSVLYRDIKGHMQDETASGVNWLEGKAPVEPSFFNFFENNIPDTRGKSQEHIKHEIAHVFRYEFWQNPFTYYDQPTYHDYQHLSEEQYQQYHEDLLQQGSGEHEQHDQHHADL